MSMKTKYGVACILAASMMALYGCDGGSSSDGAQNPEICDDSANLCVRGYSCINAVCLKDAANGDACDETTYCFDGKCVDGTCVDGTDNPQTQGGTVEIGGTCSNNKDCKQGECIGRTCTQVAEDGESCESMPCKSGSKCVEDDKICRKEARVNEPCDDKTVCLVGQCISDVCKATSEDDLLKLKDTDGDTISDFYDRCDVDTDGDGKMDCEDEDSDGDTIPDRVEGQTNGDIQREPHNSGNGYDFLLQDSDGNGIPDAFEGCPDKDNPYKGPDTPLPTEICENPVDTDGNTIPDYCDDDNDGDTIPDNIEIEGLTITINNENVPARMCDGAPCEPGTATNPWDTDGDTVPDYMSEDNDGDTIPDIDELQIDTDGDGNADLYDLDSDGDTVPDSVEKGRTYKDPKTGTIIKCVITKDCDSDGLLDADEITCDEKVYPMSGGYTGTSPDHDGDGYNDTAEYAASKFAEERCKADPTQCMYILDPFGKKVKLENPAQLICDPEYGVENVFDFYFELPYGDPKQDKELLFEPAVSKLDVVINLDVTGSMQNEINNVKTNIGTVIIPQVKQRVSDSAFGISAFADFPVGLAGDNASIRYGYAKLHSSYQADFPWKMLQKVTSEQSKLTEAVTYYALTDGMDYPESGYESLWQIANADKVTKEEQTEYAIMGYDDKGIGDDKISGYKTLDIVENDKDHWGGAGFRDGSLPVVVHITDAPSHGSTTAATVDTTGKLKDYVYNGDYIKKAHTDENVHKTYQDKGIRLLTVYRRSEADATKNGDGEGVASGAQHPVLYNSSHETSAVVPACAFKDSQSKWKCGDADSADNRCCTVTTKEGFVEAKDNECVLSYGITDGSKLSSTLVDGIDALVKYGTYDVATRILRDESNTAVDTSCFIKGVEAKAYVAPVVEPAKSCNPQAVAKKFDETKSYNDGFTNFAIGASNRTEKGANLTFTVYAQNDNCVKPTNKTQSFMAYIELYDPTTGLILGKRQVYIIVPSDNSKEEVN